MPKRTPTKTPEQAFQAEQTERLCNAIQQSFNFKNADTFEHVFGPCKEDFSLASAMHRIADAISDLAEAVRDVQK